MQHREKMKSASQEQSNVYVKCGGSCQRFFLIVKSLFVFRRAFIILRSTGERSSKEKSLGVSFGRRTSGCVLAAKPQGVLPAEN